MSEVTRRQTCTDHCATCNQHFHGLKAFDAHLNDNGERVECCEGWVAIIIDRQQKIRPALQQWTTEGWCELQKGCWADGRRVSWEHPVTIWQVALTDKALAARQEWLQGQHSKESEPMDAEPVVGVTPHA